MKGELKPYPEYKEARVTWLEKIPAHWQEKRAKFLFREIDERSIFGEEELLSVSHITGVTPRSQKNVTMFKAESYVGHKVCQPGDLVINTMWAWMAALGIAKHRGIVSSSYGIYRPHSQQNFLPEYIDQLLRTWGFVAEYNTRSTGIRSSRLRLYPDKFLNIAIPIPSLEEQQCLVNYLKLKNRKINRFIHNKRLLIKLLNEQKQVIVNQTVTHGVSSTVSPRSSGVSYLEDIPQHWEIRPLKHWVSINEKVLPETTDPEMEICYLDIGAVSTGFLVEEPEVIRFEVSPSRARRILCPGDTIISTVRTYLKAVYFINTNTPNLVASTGFAVLTPHPYLHPEFISFVIQSSPFIEKVTANSVGIAYPAISESRIGAFHVAIPPSKKEQAKIVELVKKKTKSLNAAITQAQREINLIREYHIRLISDVVTGKVDVRDIEIPALPDEDAVEDLEDEELLEAAEAEVEEVEEAEE